MRRVCFAVGLLLLPWLLPSRGLGDTDDLGFGIDSSRWDGLSELRALADAQGLTLRAPDVLQLWEVGPQDAILIIHPTHPPPSRALARFMREGGRLALFDDYGQGQALLRTFRIGRHAGRRPPVDRRLRGNSALAIAAPVGSHPLTAGVEALVLNHAQVLHHRSLQPVLSIDGEEAVALAGAVGAGRLVAFSDASVLINNMLEFDGNRRLAENLFAYLLGSDGGVLHVVAADTEILARPGLDRPENALAALRDLLTRMSQMKLPANAVWLTAWMVALTSLLAAATALPKRGRAARPLPRGMGERVAAGFDGRVDFFMRPGRNLFGAALAYKFEFETALVLGLGLAGRPSRAEVIAALRARPATAEVADLADALLSTLDALSLQQDRRPHPPRVEPARYQAMVEDGGRVLTALEVDRT